MAKRGTNAGAQNTSGGAGTLLPPIALPAAATTGDHRGVRGGHFSSHASVSLPALPNGDEALNVLQLNEIIYNRELAIQKWVKRVAALQADLAAVDETYQDVLAVHRHYRRMIRELERRAEVFIYRPLRPPELPAGSALTPAVVQQLLPFFVTSINAEEAGSATTPEPQLTDKHSKKVAGGAARDAAASKAGNAAGSGDLRKSVLANLPLNLKKSMNIGGNGLAGLSDEEMDYLSHLANWRETTDAAELKRLNKACEQLFALIRLPKDEIIALLLKAAAVNSKDTRRGNLRHGALSGTASPTPSSPQANGIMANMNPNTSLNAESNTASHLPISASAVAAFFGTGTNNNSNNNNISTLGRLGTEELLEHLSNPSARGYTKDLLGEAQSIALPSVTSSGGGANDPNNSTTSKKGKSKAQGKEVKQQNTSGASIGNASEISLAQSRKASALLPAISAAVVQVDEAAMEATYAQYLSALLPRPRAASAEVWERFIQFRLSKSRAEADNELLEQRKVALEERAAALREMRHVAVYSLIGAVRSIELISGRPYCSNPALGHNYCTFPGSGPATPLAKTIPTAGPPNQAAAAAGLPALPPLDAALSDLLADIIKEANTPHTIIINTNTGSCNNPALSRSGSKKSTPR